MLRQHINGAGKKMLKAFTMRSVVSRKVTRGFSSVKKSWVPINEQLLEKITTQGTS